MFRGLILCMTAMITFDKGPAENRNAAPSTALASFCIFDVNVSKLLITPSTLSVEMVSTPLTQAGGRLIHDELVIAYDQDRPICSD